MAKKKSDGLVTMKAPPNVAAVGIPDVGHFVPDADGLVQVEADQVGMLVANGFSVVEE